jgi:hypothetical protein
MRTVSVAESAETAALLRRESLRHGTLRNRHTRRGSGINLTI